MGKWGSTLIINIWVRFGKRPNFSHHPNIGDMSNRYFFEVKQIPKTWDICQSQMGKSHWSNLSNFKLSQQQDWWLTLW